MAHHIPEPDSNELTQGSWVQTLIEIENQLQDDSQQVRELIQEVTLLREFISRQLLEESEVLLLERRRQYQPLLVDMLEQERDLTSLNKHLTQFECLIEAYQQMIHALNLPHEFLN